MIIYDLYGSKELMDEPSLNVMARLIIEIKLHKDNMSIQKYNGSDIKD